MSSPVPIPRSSARWITLSALTVGAVFLCARWFLTRQASRRPGLRRAPHIRRRRPESLGRASASRRRSSTEVVFSATSPQLAPSHMDTVNDWNVSQSHRLMSLLYSIAEDQDRRDGYVHRGITCNNCHTTPIRGIRYRCANCADYDLCENCEVDDTHQKGHVFLKIRIPIPVMCGPRTQLLSSFYPGAFPSARPLPWSRLEEIKAKYDLDPYEVEALYDQFKSLASDHGSVEGIDEDTFYQCLGPCGVDRPLIAQRTFQMYDQDKDGLISFEEMVFSVHLSSNSSLDERIPLVFCGYDLDEDGLVGREELYKVFASFLWVHNTTLRDMIIAAESTVLDARNLQMNQPVSAAFTASIPEHPEHLVRPPRPHESNSVRNASSDEDDSDTGDKTTANNPMASIAAPLATESDRLIASEADPTDLRWPIVEILNQRSVHELVERTFTAIRPENPDYISLEEFRRFSKKDARLINWFEVLCPPF
ncbi:hypothetical protein H4R34_001883 [Dimargaris verticillata]|uniref:EF-hand n=1 Tax=Dimargaris verticillata TaxID=2761393 RepID=A0A9W8B939_9FUNG|nr:hypothetical protein H4R34_001883 [Dimargaris verticillata]